MSQSLLPECTPLKKEYDACFNSWFEGYLEPAIAAAASQEARTAYSKKKAEEFQAKCGGVWESYKACVQKAVKEKGLDKLLAQAREENPLVDPPPPSTPPK
ncbi:mitochondrial distribution/morphology family 35/apoptosis [Panaeolus papilionaceus]|nr:mitochondrial distribution/morphology family 35/apoptosis [Panaeolus papilionaceus]